MLNNSTLINLKKYSLLILLLSFSLIANAQGLGGPSNGGGGSSCTVTVDCGGTGTISCTSDINKCKRNAVEGSVTCNGITTYCGS